MTPDQEPKPETAAPSQSEASEPRRRGRRGGRGRRGRGRGRPQTLAPQALPPAEEAAALTQPVAEHAPVEREVPPAPVRERHQASPAAVAQAIEEVNQIIETLRGALNDMEEVLETLELAERQKNAEEQEIETLRRGLRQLHRPREGGPHPPRH
jgi:hypothetical protein